jgi:hypothetical protein
MPLEARDGDRKNTPKIKEKDTRDSVEWRSRTERERWREQQELQGLPRETQGHQPHDRNGDGVVSRDEWPGTAESFRRLDRDKDGLLTGRDRRLEPERRVRQ